MRSCASHKPNTPQRSSASIFGQRLPRVPSHRPIGSARRPLRPVFVLKEPQTFIGCGGGGGGGVGGSPRRWWDSDGNGPSRFRTSLLCLLCACQALEAQASPNRRHNKNQRSYGWSHDPEVNQYATNLTDLAWPLLQNLGFSGLVGIVCAVAFKAIGRAVAIGLGTTFAVVQLLAYGGFLTVQWSKIHEDILRICDVNGDGQFGATDMHSAIDSLLAMLSQGLPSVSGFCLGFGLGLRF